MRPYGNRAGDSGVVGYEAGERFVVVYFRNGWAYTYTDRSAGAEIMAEMRRRATAGRGLSTLISTRVKDHYASKRRYWGH